MVFNFITHNC